MDINVQNVMNESNARGEENSCANSNLHMAHLLSKLNDCSVFKMHCASRLERTQAKRH